MNLRRRPTPLSLTVLCLLVSGPLHPYLMQRLIKLWGKDRVVNVGQRSSLYRTINQLHEAGLIAVRQTEREQQFPERTVYELTEAGRRVGQEWLAEMLSTPRNEFPEFPAALSFAMCLVPAEALAVLERRAEQLRDQLARVEGELTAFSGRLPRVTLLETEYLRAVTLAELNWVVGVTADLGAGALTWSYEQLAAVATSFVPDPGTAAGEESVSPPSQQDASAPPA